MFLSTSLEYIILFLILVSRPPLWSSGQSLWLQIQRSRVQFPALADYLRSGVSGTGSTQPREDNCVDTRMKKQRIRSRKNEINDRGNSLRWPRITPYPQKLALTSPTCGGRSIGIVRLRTTVMEFSLVFFISRCARKISVGVGLNRLIFWFLQGG
jgi:hypothetical protein